MLTCLKEHLPVFMSHPLSIPFPKLFNSVSKKAALIVGGLGVCLCSPIISRNLIIVLSTMDFPDGEVIKNLPAIQETQKMWIRSVGEDPSEEEMATESSILAGIILWNRNLLGSSLWGLKVLDMTELSPLGPCGQQSEL